MLHEEGIADLHQLAREYLKALPSFEPGGAINLCGWSLGGKIALEMGYILEQRGFTDITIHLLDTIILDEYLINLQDNVDEAEYNAQLEAYIHSQG